MGSDRVYDEQLGTSALHLKRHSRRWSKRERDKSYLRDDPLVVLAHRLLVVHTFRCEVDFNASRVLFLFVCANAAHSSEE